jgi:hypothetical protein
MTDTLYDAWKEIMSTHFDFEDDETIDKYARAFSREKIKTDFEFLKSIDFRPKSSDWTDLGEGQRIPLGHKVFWDKFLIFGAKLS